MPSFTKLWVDDVRPLPDDFDSGEWTTARTFHEAIVKLDLIEFDEVSLDHDLASFYGNVEMTGTNIVGWLAERKHDGNHVPSVYHIHSDNPVGRRSMTALIQTYLQEDFR